MTFPVVFHIFGRPILAHQVFEAAAYFVGFQTYLSIRRRHPHPQISLDTHLWIIVAALTGAVVGSKLLAFAESPLAYWNARHTPAIWLGGKTIVGGLLGGWLAVELAKKFMHIRSTTGDAYLLPLALAIAIGRIGCFLTGLPDHTCGTPSNLPWAVDFGDHIPRHPTQLYEILAVLLIAATIHLLPRLLSPRSHIPHPQRDTSATPSSIFHPPSSPLFPPGTPFRLFMFAYLTFRFLVEFIKPRYHPYLGLSAIQLASLAGALFCLHQLRRMLRSPATDPAIPAPPPHSTPSPIPPTPAASSFDH